MDLQAKLKELKGKLEAANKKHIDAKAEKIKVDRDIVVIEKLMGKAKEIFNEQL